MTKLIHDHATRAAENVLADRKVFTLDNERWNLLAEMLDRPVQEAAGLRDLMTRPSALDDDKDFRRAIEPRSS